MTCIGVGYKRELQERVKPGGDRRSEDFQGGNITTLKSDTRDIAAAKVGVSGKVKRICPVFHEGNVRKS